jgi:hypothetical protein
MEHIHNDLMKSGVSLGKVPQTLKKKTLTNEIWGSLGNFPQKRNEL